MAEKSPELIRDIKDQGHAIGNHSYSHKYDIIYKNIDISSMKSITSSLKLKIDHIECLKLAILEAKNTYA